MNISALLQGLLSRIVACKQRYVCSSLTHHRFGPVQTNAKLFANNSLIVGYYMLRLFAHRVACYCMFLRCRSQHCWELLHPFAHQCQRERNNSQHCQLNICWSCCVCLHVAQKKRYVLTPTANSTEDNRRGLSCGNNLLKAQN